MANISMISLSRGKGGQIAPKVTLDDIGELHCHDLKMNAHTGVLHIAFADSRDRNAESIATAVLRRLERTGLCATMNVEVTSAGQDIFSISVTDPMAAAESLRLDARSAATIRQFYDEKVIGSRSILAYANNPLLTGAPSGRVR